MRQGIRIAPSMGSGIAPHLSLTASRNWESAKALKMRQGIEKCAKAPEMRQGIKKCAKTSRKALGHRKCARAIEIRQKPKMRQSTRNASRYRKMRQGTSNEPSHQKKANLSNLRYDTEYAPCQNYFKVSRNAPGHQQ